jgi:hypothetical protein
MSGNSYNTLFRFLFAVKKVQVELNAAWARLKAIRCGAFVSALSHSLPLSLSALILLSLSLSC